jgi:hypothetical protein
MAENISLILSFGVEDMGYSELMNQSLKSCFSIIVDSVKRTSATFVLSEVE